MMRRSKKTKLDKLDKIANKDAERDIDVFPWNSSELSSDYIRVAIQDEYLGEFIASVENKDNKDSKLIAVEYDGQSKFITGKDDDGNDVALGCINGIPIDGSWED